MRKALALAKKASAEMENSDRGDHRKGMVRSLQVHIISEKADRTLLYTRRYLPSVRPARSFVHGGLTTAIYMSHWSLALCAQELFSKQGSGKFFSVHSSRKAVPLCQSEYIRYRTESQSGYESASLPMNLSACLMDFSAK